MLAILLRWLRFRLAVLDFHWNNVPTPTYCGACGQLYGIQKLQWDRLTHWPICSPCVGLKRRSNP